jgi:hypothetical protein
VLLLLTLFGCGPVNRYDALREQCGVNDRTPLPWGMDGVYAVIDARCAAALGNVVNLDWSSFGEEPHTIAVPTSGSDLIIGGLFTLIASDVGSVGDLQDALEPEELLSAQFPGGLTSSRFDEDDPAAAFWLDYVAERIEGVRFEPYEDCSLQLAVYDVMETCLESVDEAPIEYGGHPGDIASGLIHEAGHVDGPGHDAGPSGTWDADASTTGGLQARWLNSWALANEGTAAAADHDNLVYYRWLVCTYIVDPGTFGPCSFG